MHPKEDALNPEKSLASQRSTKTKVWDTVIVNGAVSPVKTHVKDHPGAS